MTIRMNGPFMLADDPPPGRIYEQKEIMTEVEVEVPTEDTMFLHELDSEGNPKTMPEATDGLVHDSIPEESGEPQMQITPAMMKKYIRMMRGKGHQTKKKTPPNVAKRKKQAQRKARKANRK